MMIMAKFEETIFYSRRKRLEEEKKRRKKKLWSIYDSCGLYSCVEKKNGYWSKLDDKMNWIKFRLVMALVVYLF